MRLDPVDFYKLSGRGHIGTGGTWERETVVRPVVLSCAPGAFPVLAPVVARFY